MILNFSNVKKYLETKGEEEKNNKCAWGDSNSHTLGHHPLKMACLPIPPHAQKDWDAKIQLLSYFNNRI